MRIPSSAAQHYRQFEFPSGRETKLCKCIYTIFDNTDSLATFITHPNGPQAFIADLIQPYLDAKASSSPAAHTIPSAAWRGLQMAVAILHLLQRPPSGATAGATAAASSLPREAADQLAAAEVALLERHLARVLTCAASELHASGLLL